MKFNPLFLASLAVLSLLSQNLVAQDDTEGELRVIEVKPKQVYTPMGFGENNIAQIGIEGEFPNGCYRLKGIEWSHEEDRISFRAKALKYVGPCLQKITPWFILQDLDLLEAKTHKIFNPLVGSEPMANLPIKASLSKKHADEKSYAPVDGFILGYDENLDPTVTLTGYFDNSCTAFKDTDEPMIHKTNESVIEILPETVTLQEPNCQSGKFAFTKTLHLPAEIPAGKYMIYVRIDGNTGIAKREWIVKRTR